MNLRIDTNENKPTAIKRHLSITFSTMVFFLLTHGSYLPSWIRVSCGAVVILSLCYLHLLFRKQALAG